MPGTDKKYTYIDHLDEDDPLPNQKWVCVSFLSPEGISNCKIRGLKVRGVFATKEEADACADKLGKKDRFFDIHVGELGKWLPWDPEPNSAENQVYKEKELNELMFKHKQNVDKAAELQAERKADMVNEAIKEERERRKKEKTSKKSYVNDALKKLESKGSKLSKADKKKLKKKLSKEHKKSELEEKKHLAEAERERLGNVNEEIQKKKDELKNVDAQYDKIKKLYQKLKKQEEKNDSDVVEEVATN